MTRKRKLTIWGGSGFVPGQEGQQRIIFAARTQKEAVELSGYRTVNSLKKWFSVTGNEHEIRTALEKPGVVLFRPLNQVDDEFQEASDDE